MFVIEWSSAAKGKCLERHGVTDNKFQPYLDLKSVAKMSLDAGLNGNAILLPIYSLYPVFCF